MSSVQRLVSFPGVLPTNPYQRLLYAQVAQLGLELTDSPGFRLRWLWSARQRVSVLHFHWPQSFWRHRRGPPALMPVLSYVKLALFGVRLATARALGYRIAWTIHQVYPHEVDSRRLDRLGARTLATLSHVLLAHDAATRAIAVGELGRTARRIEIVPHGSYIGVYPPGRDRATVRAQLGVEPDSVLFLCFGQLRAYKDLDFLLDAFRGAQLPRAALVIAGPVADAGVADRVRALAARDPRIKPRLEYVPDSSVAELFAACDASVVARNDGGTSASVILGISMGVPVIAAHHPAYEALLDGGAAGWLFRARDSGSLGRALEAAAGAPDALRREKGRVALRRAEELRWPEIGARTAALLRGET
jgi:beta-1,4-mannosyltransferase